jgi:hypothetical protein
MDFWKNICRCTSNKKLDEFSQIFVRSVNEKLGKKIEEEDILVILIEIPGKIAGELRPMNPYSHKSYKKVVYFYLINSEAEPDINFVQSAPEYCLTFSNMNTKINLDKKIKELKRELDLANATGIFTEKLQETMKVDIMLSDEGARADDYIVNLLNS